MDVDVFSHKQRLDYLFQQVSGIADEEMKSHWARYLCVLVAGFIENSLRIMLVKYAAAKSHPNVANYVNNKIKNITNLNNEKLKQLLGSFNSDWGKIIEDNVLDDQREAIDSILANRHQIAHGQPVGITYARVNQYYAKVVRTIEIIYETCLKI
jgi:hypothetical protein